jgi:16S rRNA processing protein RimM
VGIGVERQGMTAREDSRMVLLGRVSGLFGVKGWIKVYSDTEPRDNILNYSPWYLRRQGEWQPFEVVAGQRHGKGIVAHLANCPDRDMAAELIGSDIAVPREQLPAPDEEEYYWSDLRGLTVITLQGVDLGQVINLMETGANDVLVVREAGEQGRERLIPFIRQQVIQEVDLERGVLIVDWDPEF